MTADARAWAWVGGGLVDAGAPAIAVDDRGFTVGDAVFETVKVVGGVPFALTRHLARLARSCDVLGIAPPAADEVRAAVRAVVEANPAVAGAGRVARLRVTVTSGRAPLGPGRGAGEPTLVVAVGPGGAYGPTAAVTVAPWVRNERAATAGAKTTSYAENAVAFAWAARAGVDEVLFANTRDELCEGAGSNVFVVLDGELVTPPLSSGCLAGVTRDLVLGLGLGAAERPVAMADLPRASEAFLTSTTRDVQPIHRIDDRELSAPGPHTAAAQAAWRELEARTTDP